MEALKEIYKEFDNVQVIIFMNTRSFAVTLMNILKKSGYEAKLLMGGDMSTEERDEILRQFRAGSIHFLITTNLLARGIDVDGMSFVVNFDVPFYKDRNGLPVADPETYLHRIGRTGRFNTKGIAVTLIDTKKAGDRDINILRDIENEFKMKVQELKDIKKELFPIAQEHLGLES